VSHFIAAPKLSPVWKNGGTNGTTWYLLESFLYVSDVLNDTVVVPAGFMTDFASIPREFWNLLPPWGTYGPAAIVHDYLYATQTATKENADLVLHEAMAASGVDHAVAEIIYKAVELFGHAAWERDLAQAAAGFQRIYNAQD
jgi:hypothetical protein